MSRAVALLALLAGCASTVDQVDQGAAELGRDHGQLDAELLDAEPDQADDVGQLDAGRPCNGAMPCPDGFECVVRLADGSVGAYCEPQ